MNLKATKAILLACVFNVLIYFVHSSISNLGKVDLLSGDFNKSAEEKLVQYRRAQNETKLEYEDLEYLEIRKCCPDTDVFNEALKCSYFSEPLGENIYFFPNSMIIDEHFIQVPSNISYSIDILEADNHCNDQAILFKDGDPMNYFIMQKTGDLVQLDASQVIVNNYSRDYCLDVMHNKDGRYFVFMLCPCEQNVCVKKCCPMGQYYNTETKTCAKNLQEHKQWKLDFYKKEEKMNTVNHFLFNKQLNCSGNPDQLINNLSEPHDLFVQGNGSLWHNMENRRRFTEPSNYCVDMFSDGKNNSHTNGFFCDTTSGERRVRERPHPINKCCRYGASLNKNFFCQRTPKNVEHVTPPKFMADAVSKMEYTNFMVPTGYLSIKLTTKDYTQQSYNRRKIKFTIKDIFENYHYSMFCIDEYHNGHHSDFAVIFTPCKTELCLQKCCPPGYFYDVNENGCRKNIGVSKKNFEVYQYKGFRRVGRAAEYFLIYSEPDCRGFEKPLFNNIGYNHLQIQENGDIIKEKEQYSNYVWTHPLRYCVDIFSDGEISLANGFFCAKKSSKERRILAKEGYIMPPMTGDSSDKRSSPAIDTATKPYESILLLCLINSFYYYYF